MADISGFKLCNDVRDPGYILPNDTFGETTLKIETDSDNTIINPHIQALASIHGTSSTRGETASIPRGGIGTDKFIICSVVDKSSVKMSADMNIAAMVNKDVPDNLNDNPNKKRGRPRKQTEEVTDDSNDSTYVKKGRTRKEREQSKKLRNSGQCYVTETGKLIPERQLRPLSTCRMKCVERFSEIERKQCFDEYWSLGSSERRVMYVSRLVTIVPKKSQKADITHNRDCSCKYKLIINNEEKPICKECLSRTLGDSKGFVSNVILKKKLQMESYQLEPIKKI